MAIHQHQQQRAKPGTLTSKVRRIVIGDWNLEAINSDDLIMKCYFAKRKLLLEILDRSTEPDNEGNILKRKMEINWSDLLSFQMHTDPGDSTGVFRLELNRCPIFSIETNQQPKKHTQWRRGEDFTTNSSASIYRIHTLYFSPGELQKNLEKLRSGDDFWCNLAATPFPISTSPFYGLNVNQNVSALNNDTNFQTSNMSYYPLLGATNTMINSYPIVETEAREMVTEERDLQYGGYFNILDTVAYSHPLQRNSMMIQGENLRNMEYSWQYEEGNLQMLNTTPLYVDNLGNMMPQQEEGEEGNLRTMNKPRNFFPPF